MGSVSSKEEICVACSNHDEHCCKHECFNAPNKKQIGKELSLSMNKYLDEGNYENIIAIILEYLTIYLLTKETYNGYDIYCHSDALLYYELKKNPCQLWMHFTITDKNMPTLNILIVGSDLSSKSSFVYKFFPSYNKNNIYNTFNVAFKNSAVCTYNVWSTDTFSDNINNVMTILCFDVNKTNSFNDEIIKYYNKILTIKKEKNLSKKDNDIINIATIIVATNCDLLNDSNNNDSNNNNSNLINAIKHAHKWNIPLIETNSIDNTNIDHLIKITLYEYWIQSIFTKQKPHKILNQIQPLNF